MKLYLTRQQALAYHPLTEGELDNLINTGQVDAVLIDHDGEKTLALYDDDLRNYITDRDITPEQFNDRRGKLLGLSEAGMKYSVNPRTVARWASQGVLEVKGTEGQKKLVDEADVAYLAAVGRAKKMRPGKKPFSQSD